METDFSAETVSFKLVGGMHPPIPPPKSATGDTSSLWKIINKIIHLKKVKKNNIPNKMYASKSESAQGPQVICNLFNKYFTEIGFNLASTIETPAIIDGKFNATSLIE